MANIIKREDAFIIKYLQFLNKDTVYEGISDDADNGKTPDYYIPELNYLVEVKGIYDKSEMESWAIWGKIIANFKQALKDNISRLDLNGTFLINTPDNLRMPTDKDFYNNAVTKLISSIRSNDMNVNIHGYEFSIDKVSKQGSDIAFGSIGTGHSINVASIIYDNIKKQLKSANSQLGYKYSKRVDKRIALLINQYRLLSWNWELFDGISYAYKELLNYENIDEIWVQSDKGLTFVFDRKFFSSFEKKSITEVTKEQYILFGNWFSPLDKLGEDKKEKLLSTLKLFLKDRKPYQVFPESINRIEMVRFGRWLCENKMAADANWLIQQFLDDPDPIDPPNDNSEDDGNKLHESIKRAKKSESHTIHTVKGHLAWTVQLLALRNEYLKQAFTCTQSVLRSTKNLYLVLQWTFPLIEISNRRFWLKEVDEASYKDFKKLCFEVLHNYSRYPDIAQGLAHVFHYFKELTTEDTKEVLDKLEKAEDYEALLLYFAIYRERHFKDAKYEKAIREYDPTYAKNKLNLIILSEDNELLDLRSGIAWNIWKILSEDDKVFDTLSPLIDSYLTTTYSNHLYHNFERIVEDCLDKYTEKCLDWALVILNSIKDHLDKNSDEGRNVWLGTEIKKVLDKLGEKRPEKLIEVMEVLYEIWMKGAYIGTISEIFSTYKSISNESLRNTGKEKYRELYQKMKAVNEKLESVSWG